MSKAAVFTRCEHTDKGSHSDGNVPNLLPCCEPSAAFDEPGDVPSLYSTGKQILTPVPEEVSWDVGLTSPQTSLDVGTDKDFLNLSGNEDIIVWFGSTAAKAFQCRGWNRSDDEWQRKSEIISRRRDINLLRCVEDPKFRTRLCNHWDTSLGTFCPMRKKNKCIFAHGPVELRVKEAKRSRWGKLVDQNGDCNNPNHSGGEDTYGAARSIESERKQEGKWKAKSTNGTKGKSTDRLKLKSSKETSLD
jgi:hypothetical protein